LFLARLGSSEPLFQKRTISTKLENREGDHHHPHKNTKPFFKEKTTKLSQMFHVSYHTMFQKNTTPYNLKILTKLIKKKEYMQGKHERKVKDYFKKYIFGNF
jgi:hypothetical protein